MKNTAAAGRKSTNRVRPYMTTPIRYNNRGRTGRWSDDDPNGRRRIRSFIDDYYLPRHRRRRFVILRRVVASCARVVRGRVLVNKHSWSSRARGAVYAAPSDEHTRRNLRARNSPRPADE